MTCPAHARPMGTPPRDAIGPALCAYLDAVRFGAAMLVVLHHWLVVARIPGWGWLRVGDDAVMVFFALSGFVIAHTAATKDRDIASFAFNRATRVYSVAVPAVAVTFLIDALVHGRLPSARQAVAALTFTTDQWFATVETWSNFPWWSLSYEVWYYAAFACLFYLRGWRRALGIAAVVLIAGPRLLLLAPAWFAGVAAYRAATARPMDRSAAWCAALLPPAAYLVLKSTIAYPVLAGAPAALLGPEASLSLLSYARAFPWQITLAMLAAVNIVGVASLRRGNPAGPRGVGWLAGAGFSIYLMHVPFLELFGTLIGGSGAVLALTLAACFLFAACFERPLPAVRSSLLWAWHRHRAGRGVAPAMVPLFAAPGAARPTVPRVPGFR